MQMGPEDVLQVLQGLDSARRRDIAATNRKVMRTQLRCDALPAVRASLTRLAEAGYPQWFVHEFFHLPQDADEWLPCPAGTGDPAACFVG